MSALRDPRLARIAVLGTLLVALAAGGCGRKGGLDPPASPAVAAPVTVAPEGAPVQAAPEIPPVLAPPPSPPPPPPPPTRWTPLDFLLD